MFPYALLTFAPNTDAELGNGVAASLPILGGWLTFKQTFLSQCNQMHITASRCSSTTSALTACCHSPYYFNPEQASRKYKLPEVLEGKTLLFDNLSQLSLAEQECPAWSMQDSCILTSPKLYSIPPSHIMHICSLAQGTF